MKKAIKKETYRRSVAKDLIRQSYKNMDDQSRFVLFQGLLFILDNDQIDLALDVRDSIRNITKK